MALRGCTRKVSGFVQVHSRCLRKSIKTQPCFSGLSAQCVWHESLGFGSNNDGRLVLVTKNSEQCIDAYDYNKLFGPPPEAEQLVRSSLKQPYIDRDLWREGRTLQGNAPWARPLLPHRGGYSACFSSLAGDGQSSGSSASADSLDPSLIIFDKDGTLIDVDSVWIPWMESYVRELEAATGLDLADKLYQRVGFCPKTRSYTDGGLLAHATIAEIMTVFVSVLVNCGVNRDRAEKLVDNCCKEFDSGSHDTLQPLGDLPLIFETLRAKGVKTAICTADSREGTMSALDRLGLMEMVDKIVCGDDKDTKPKPHPETALEICKELNVCPTQTVIIGDTGADTTMGRSAGLGLTVGVLSGAGSKTFLEKEADVVLNNVDELLDTLFPEESS